MKKVAKAPNELRQEYDFAPMTGGDSPYFAAVFRFTPPWPGFASAGGGYFLLLLFPVEVVSFLPEVL